MIVFKRVSDTYPYKPTGGIHEMLPYIFVKCKTSIRSGYEKEGSETSSQEGYQGSS